MKKRISALLVCIALFMSILTSCLFTFECEVTYDYRGARDNLTVTVVQGSLIPNDVPKRDGHVFGGWYTDDKFKESYDFTKPISSDITLYAKWIKKSEQTPDLKDLVNEITTSAVRATVQLSVEKYDLQGSGIFATKKNISNSTGSGVIYAEESGYYYCLTNNHVVAKGSKTNADIGIIDYQLETYEAELVASDADYDLAVVKFKKNLAEPLAKIELGTADLAVGETVIAIGSPGGQMNAVTFGEMLVMESVSIDPDAANLSNVTFPVIRHDAHMDNGSSGGVLLNTSLKIAGINFAAASGEDGEFVFGYAVPAAKVSEFLAKYNLLK